MSSNVVLLLINLFSGIRLFVIVFVVIPHCRALCWLFYFRFWLLAANCGGNVFFFAGKLFTDVFRHVVEVVLDVFVYKRL